jgi:hypothetical protein
MGKHISFLGYSIWVQDDNDNGNVSSNGQFEYLYSPLTLAAYSILSSAGVGCILYGINLSRRDEKLKGYVFVGLAILFLMFTVFVAIRSQPVLLNILFGVSLYQIERQPFDRSVRRGFQRAKWWPPLFGVLLLVLVSWLVGWLR